MPIQSIFDILPPIQTPGGGTYQSVPPAFAPPVTTPQTATATGGSAEGRQDAVAKGDGGSININTGMGVTALIVGFLILAAIIIIAVVVF